MGLVSGVAWAHFDGLLATDLQEVADLAERPDALDSGGWWAVRGTFEGRVQGYRFGTVRVAPLPAARRPWRGPHASDWVSSLSREQYLAGMATIKRHIEAGNVYQVNLCRVLTAPLPLDAQPQALAAILFDGNPAPYQGVLHTGDDWVVTASPELFLARDGDRIWSAPIKGTATLDGDFLPKDIAENVMISDLVRNDLNRVCRPDSVRVPALLAAEDHPGLRHLVTTVAGRLRPGIGWSQILDAAYPPGSVSGAPKLRALEVINAVESVPRGVYCGTVGWIDADHSTARLAVAIRTFATSADPTGPVLRFGTGAGITHPSDPAGEWDETELKAARLISLASRPITNRHDGMSG